MNASLIKELRDISGAGLMDCKKALEANDGDIDKAMDYLREKGISKAAKKADIIIGPIGIVIADAMIGEITPQMAVAIGQADAARILLPINKCDNLVAGVSDITMTAIVEDAIGKVKALLK